MSKQEKFNFKRDHSLEERQNESNRILREYPNRLPVICEKAPKTDLPAIQKTKYLIPSDMTVSQFAFLIRRNIDLNENSAIYLITSKGKGLILNQTIMEAYNIHKDKEDGFLYLYYASELTWG